MTGSAKQGRLLLAGALSAVLIALSSAGVAHAATPPSEAAGDVFYSPTTTVPQSKSAAGMRTYLSTNQPQYTLQSYVWSGSLVDDNGKLSTFAMEMQRNDGSIDGSPNLPFVSSAALYNRTWDPGYVVGGFVGVADLTLPLSLTSRPWSVRAQSFTPGQLPQFTDVRVVKGILGKKGAVYEFTTYVPNGAEGAPANQMLELYIRAEDTTGVMMWGYGPSGFFPQWIYPAQRALITGTYGNSVGKYLSKTDDPMTNQGDYYYTMPLLQVQRFTASIGGTVVSKGTSGTLWFDNVDQQIDTAAKQIMGNGVNWLEFSVQIPKSGQAMKIGHVVQSSVGELSYAMLHRPDSPKAKNGAFTNSLNWNMDKVHITPVASSAWTSPVSHQQYFTKYHVVLDGSKKKSADFTLKAKFANQELNVQGRSVYEGLFSLSGTLAGKHVNGQAWAEVQPAGKL